MELRSEIRSQLLTQDTNVDSQKVHCFPSTLPISWNEIKLYVTAGIVFVFSYALTSIVKTHGHISAILVVGISLTIITLLISSLVRKEARREYEKAIQTGKWQEGIFVFPTGDVVVRFNRPALQVDQEFPPQSITFVQGNEQNLILYILWKDAMGNKLTFNVDCKILVDKPKFIAQEMTKLLRLPEGNLGGEV